MPVKKFRTRGLRKVKRRLWSVWLWGMLIYASQYEDEARAIHAVCLASALKSGFNKRDIVVKRTEVR